ncbi:MAG: alpha/beta hydrolase [Lachnospiraceae bacterium]|nr:alpha/beta hydrolase [Lachnospiraceae bacterium]
MKQEKDIVTIDNKTCHIVQRGENGPVVLWGMFPHQGDEIQHMTDTIKRICPKKEFILAAFQAEDWNRDFSPWKAPAAYGEGVFEGEGKVTLAWLEQSFIPYLKEQFGERPLILAGYSLAGIFALWAGYESETFDGIICGSGSLWFDKWDEYVSTHSVKSNCKIYLSLGRKEEKTRNKTMALVGDRTRAQEEILKADPNVSDVILEWNNGGHFADSGERLAKGIDWMI